MDADDRRVMRMIHTLLALESGVIQFDVPIERISLGQEHFFWVDFSQPTEKEAQYLSSVFKFHHLAIEDCVHMFQRPKVDDYGEYRFFVFHAPMEEEAQPDEINLFVGQNYLVSFHKSPNPVIERIWHLLQETPERLEKGTDYLLYLVVDGLVDSYLPLLNRLGEELEDLEARHLPNLSQEMINRIFAIRKKLLSLRRSVEPLNDVLNSIMHPEDDRWKTKYRVFFRDVQDNVIRLMDMTEVYRHMGLDLIESLVSLNSQRMNRVMVILTVITTIFMPLSFIVGIYGMNFDNMPELHWKYGYFMVLGLMAFIAWSMVHWFKHKNWF